VAWRFARDPTVNRHMTKALKTWRKRKGAMILAPQSTGDTFLRTVIDSCPTKGSWRTCLRPRQQVLIRRPKPRRSLT
jgi:type IV secretory pathway VirB4 component